MISHIQNAGRKQKKLGQQNLWLRRMTVDIHGGQTSYTYTSVRPTTSGLLSGLSPRTVTTANGSDLAMMPDRFLRPLALRESWRRVVIVLYYSPALIRLAVQRWQCQEFRARLPGCRGANFGIRSQHSVAAPCHEGERTRRDIVERSHGEPAASVLKEWPATKEIREHR